MSNYWCWQLSVISVFFILGLMFPIRARAYELWSDDPHDTALNLWSERWNAQYQYPTAPCRAPGVPRFSWQRTDSGRLRIALQDSTPCLTVLAPSALPALPDTWAFHFTTQFWQVWQDRNWFVSWQDDQSWFGVHQYGPHLNFAYRVAGRDYTLTPAQVSYPFVAGQEYVIELTYKTPNRQLILQINAQTVASIMIDPNAPPLSAAPAFGASVGAERTSISEYWNIGVAGYLESFDLPLQSLKQTQKPWAQATYDHARRWSPSDPQISRWGCALTSVTMLLRFYGFRTLPDGTSLFPDSLNAWLVAQPDGYFGDGLLNWRAIARLSALLSRTQQLPSLEYQYVARPTQPLLWLRNQVLAQKPIILAEPHHFILASGWNFTQDQARILDPFHNFTSLASYQNTFQSARVFTPSHTDHSALVLWAPPTLSLVAYNDQGNEIPLQEEWETTLTPDGVESPPLSPDLRLLTLSHPSPGTLTFTTRSSIPGPVLIFTYDQYGDLHRYAEFLLPDQSMSFSVHQEGSEKRIRTPAQSWQPLTQEQLEPLVWWRQLHSPLILIEFLWYQDHIAQAETLEQAERLSRQWHQRAMAWETLGWGESLALQTLSAKLEQEILQFWP